MMRTIASLLLSLMLAFTSQSMAVARGASAATGEMVLCTGTGPMAIYVDAEGKPTSAPHICPDAALHVVVDGPVDVARPSVVELSLTLSPVRAASLLARHHRAAPPSRAPPLLV